MIKALWNDQIPEKDGVKSPINDICISPGFIRYSSLILHKVIPKFSYRRIESCCCCWK